MKHQIVKIILFVVGLSCAHLIQASPYHRLYNGTLLANQYKKIVGGAPVEQGELPYQLSLRFLDLFHICGASLTTVRDIQVALTAAHCVDRFGASAFSLVAGDINLEDTTGIEQERKIVKIVVHEDYSVDTAISNDLAILFLDSPFELNENVAIIDLPEESQETIGDLVISGWGSLYGGGPSSITLQKITTPVIDHDLCAEKWKHHPSFPMQLGDGILCSGVPTGDTSPCHGDSGGPARSSSGNYLAGIVSFGDPSCQHPDYPSGFTKVSKYVKWIDEQVDLYLM